MACSRAQTRSESLSLSLLWFCPTGSILRPCVGKMLQQPFCPLRFNFRGKEQVLQSQHSHPAFISLHLVGSYQAL